MVKKLFNPNTLEGKLNLLLLSVFFLYGITTLAVKLHPSIPLELLRAGFGASLVGAIADSYAVYGLFYKLGPHTDLLRRKRKELTKKVLEFVDTVILDVEFIKRELEQARLTERLAELAADKELRERLKRQLSLLVQRKLEEKLEGEGGGYAFLKNFLAGIGDKVVEVVVDTVAERLVNDPEFRRALGKNLNELIAKALEEHKTELLNLVEKKLNSIPDGEFVEALKKASWNELQFIRLNGAFLGFVIGVLLKAFELLI
jgi:uncharacterized membrane-anchored protein YjiN (DUF445 family)